MKFASSAEERSRQIRQGTGPMGFWLETGGEFRVVEEVRPRTVKSAAEYLQTIEYEAHALPLHEIVEDLLAHVPLADSDALEFIWPSTSECDFLPSLASLSLGTRPSLHEQSIRGLIVSILKEYGTHTKSPVQLSQDFPSTADRISKAPMI